MAIEIASPSTRVLLGIQTVTNATLEEFLRELGDSESWIRETFEVAGIEIMPEQCRSCNYPKPDCHPEPSHPSNPFGMSISPHSDYPVHLCHANRSRVCRGSVRNQDPKERALFESQAVAMLNRYSERFFRMWEAGGLAVTEINREHQVLERDPDKVNE